MATRVRRTPRNKSTRAKGSGELSNKAARKIGRMPSPLRGMPRSGSGPKKVQGPRY